MTLAKSKKKDKKIKKRYSLPAATTETQNDLLPAEYATEVNIVKIDSSSLEEPIEEFKEQRSNKLWTTGDRCKYRLYSCS